MRTPAPSASRRTPPRKGTRQPLSPAAELRPRPGARCPPTTARHLPQKARRPARRTVARHPQRRHDARAVKTAFQAEIDSACELIDFWRFNVMFGEEILREQPGQPRGMWNQSDHRPLEGFVYAITPFNFTAIAGNLPTAPALMEQRGRLEAGTDAAVRNTT